MKDIMTDCSMEETKKEATRMWHEYKAASQAFKDPIYADLQKVYNQVKGGRKVIDIGKVILKGGVRNHGEPRLAIAMACAKKVRCNYSISGKVEFQIKPGFSSRKPTSSDIVIEGMPVFKWGDGNQWRSKQLEAPVPMIPAKLRPKVLTDDFYILWEVDVWKMVPPTDPYLLKRITKNIFVVLAGWDLTEIEKMAMAGRMG